MPLPSVEEVNQTRLTRFDDAITMALEETTRIDAFRDIIAHYVRHHDVPEADVAAALAVVAQGETPLLLTEEDDRKFQRDRAQAAKFLDDRGDRGADDRRDRPDRGPREQRDDFTMYRIEVGRRQRVQPGQIVGALANEGGLSRGDFGRIQVRDDFSLVELPKQLTAEQQERLATTRISGKLIELRPDRGPQRGGGDRYDRGDRGGGDRYDRGDRGDRHDRGNRGPRDDRAGRGDRNGWSDRGGRGDRQDRGARDGWSDRGGRSDRNDRNDRNDRGGSRGDGSDRPRKPRW